MKLNMIVHSLWKLVLADRTWWTCTNEYRSPEYASDWISTFKRIVREANFTKEQLEQWTSHQPGS